VTLCQVVVRSPIASRIRISRRVRARSGTSRGLEPSAQNLRWKTFETTLDIGMLRDYIARLPDFAGAGRHSEALEWVRKRGRPGLKVMTYDDLAVAQSLGDHHRVVMPVRSALLQGDESLNILPAVGDRLTQSNDPVCLRAPFPVPVRVLDWAEGSLHLS
jgi:hypothetical protein